MPKCNHRQPEYDSFNEYCLLCIISVVFCFLIYHKPYVKSLRDEEHFYQGGISEQVATKNDDTKALDPKTICSAKENKEISCTLMIENLYITI